MENGHLSMIYPDPLNIVSFHSYVSLPEGKWILLHPRGYWMGSLGYNGILFYIYIYMYSVMLWYQ